MAKAKRKTRPQAPDIIAPTPEQQRRGTFRQGGIWATGQNERDGVAFRREPVIVLLLASGVLSRAEFDALDYYRDQASRAEKSPVKSCCDNSPKGSGHFGPGAAIISSMLETGRIERDLGVLRDIARAVAVDDKSIQEWCVDHYGGRERYGKGGKFIGIVPNNEKDSIRMATMELKMAARRITR